jgi:hypothetical protein
MLILIKPGIETRIRLQARMFVRHAKHRAALPRYGNNFGDMWRAVSRQVCRQSDERGSGAEREGVETYATTLKISESISQRRSQ